MLKLLFFILLFSFGCKQIERRESRALKKAFPFDFVAQISTQVGNSLTANQNKDVVRIWVVSSLIGPKLLYTFSKDSTSHFSQVCLFYQDSVAYTSKRINDTLKIKEPFYILDSLTCYRTKTHLSVKEIIDTTFSLGIDKMNSQSDEAKAKVGDGENYILEIKKGNFYRIIEYSNPDYIQDDDHIKFDKYLDLVLNRKL